MIMWKDMMRDMGTLGFVSYILVLIGAIDLGIYGLFGIDIITSIFGGLLGRILFILIGAGAGYLIYELFTKKKAS